MRSFMSLFAIVSMNSLLAAPIPKELKPQIVVALKTGKHFQLFELDWEGKNPQPLTDDDSNAVHPVWSPDGKKIAFCSDRNDQVDARNRQLFVMDADGKNAKKLSSGQFTARTPVWTADGKSIVFSRGSHRGCKICEVSADGGEIKEFSDCDGSNYDPAVSPDGKKIVFISSRLGVQFRLYMMDRDGSNEKKLHDGHIPLILGSPQWSHDGKYIAFCQHKDGIFQIHRMNADGTDVRQLTSGKQDQLFPNWTPDDSQIKFHQSVYRQDTIASIDPDGKNLTEHMKLAVDKHEGGSPSWRYSK